MKAYLQILMLAAFGISSAYSDTLSAWNGGTGNWGTGPNWTPPVVPNNSASNAFDVTIGSGGTDVVSLDAGLSPTVNSLSLGGSAGTSTLRGPVGVMAPSPDTLTVVNGMTVNKTGTVGFVTGDSLTVKGSLTNDGSITVYPPGSLFAGNLVNSGQLMLFSDPVAHNTFSVPGTLTNNGFVELGSGLNGPTAPVTTIGQLVNSGSLFIGGGTVVLTNQPNGITDVTGGIDLTIANIVAGSKSAFANLTSIKGRLAFNLSPQTLTVTPQNPSATLTIGPSGTLSFIDGQNWTVASNLTNSGSIFFGGDERQQGPNVLNVLGTLTNTGSIPVNPNGSGFSQVNARTLENGGSITVPPSSGDVFPLIGGVTVGTGAPKQGYTQYADGTLDELIFGVSRYGTMAVNGPVSLAGGLDILLGGGFLPTIGEQFTILTFTPGELSGAFDTLLNPYFAISYDNTDGRIVLTAETVPEPATWFLIGAGLIGLGGYCYRRRLRTPENVSTRLSRRQARLPSIPIAPRI